jgi:hypothetical protein
LAELLAPGEVVLWVGAPAPSRYAKQMEKLWTMDSSCLSRLVAYALAGLVVGSFFMAEGAINKLPSPFNWVVAIVGFGAIVGTSALAWHSGVRYFATERAAKMIYVITDRRVIESLPGDTKSYSPADLSFLTVRAVIHEVGDVLFTVVTVPVDESAPEQVMHGLIGVERPHDVAMIVRAAFPSAPFARQSRYRWPD